MFDKAKRLSASLLAICMIFVAAMQAPQTVWAAETFETVYADRTMIKSGDDRWDIRIEAGQKEKGYDTIQGACSYKGYAYMALYNRDREKIKIAKVNLKTMEVEMVSKPLSVKAHGNTLTYNSGIKRIIVVCGKEDRNRIVFVDPETLEVTASRTISVSTKRLGEKYYGINSLAYNKSKKIYILKVRNKSGKIVLLDKNFKFLKMVKPKGYRSFLLSQGLYTEGDYMYDLQSFTDDHLYNLITVRKLETGELVGRIRVYSGKKGQLYELENLFHNGDDWYISCYRAEVKESGDTERKNYLFKINNMPEL